MIYRCSEWMKPIRLLFQNFIFLQSNDGSTVYSFLSVALFLRISISHVKLFPFMADKNKLKRNISNSHIATKCFELHCSNINLFALYILLNSMDSTNATVFLAERNCKLQQCCEFSGSPLRTRQPSNRRTDIFVTGWSFFVWFKCVYTKLCNW